LRVTVIATGLSPAKRIQQSTPMTMVHSTLRTGTDNLPIMSTMQVPGSGTPTQAPPQHDYSQLTTPSVWRHGRTQAAAKVDALASNGMDEIEIPAFLRKQAD
jgi:cell division protein FtsZ